MARRIMGWLACAGAIALLVVAMVTGTAPASAAAAPARVAEATVRLAIVAGRPAAGYFTLSALAAPVELVRVTSPAARVELHDTSMAGGIMRMNALPSVRVAAGHALRFRPGGAHLMLFDIAAGVRPGATLPLTFIFADGTRLAVAARVVGHGAGDLSS